ncbi:uncharacterized membrane protein YjjP (DUF1212 family) [Friedmanniella endophytica]|uniref:Uncharacterized membrane protein YjjP (DUF1212 family) n=1 Tax=Microlunatus kandeliicorticis TaxID=1759536 RepID=A0A7W3ITR8_9ACTN|nr:threonine/serine exporter family protein [Microlunatus kandeliicorticis]MBA8795079.1 uncharacterized membrane protein YjjP (DUF1212 family) [Microlunatus kandeliicorticis]
MEQSPPATRTDGGADEDVRLRRLLTSLGAAMTAAGQPTHEVETEVVGLAAGLGRPDAQVAVAPTLVTLALGRGEPASVAATGGPLRLDQTADLVVVRYQVSAGLLTPAAALDRIAEIRAKVPRYPGWVLFPGWLLVSVGITAVLQPGWANIGLAAVAGLLVAALVRVAAGRPLLTTLLPTLAALVAGLVIFGAAEAGWVIGPLRTLLPPLAVLLPGALLTTGIAELAAGAMVAGSSRLAFGTVQVLLFALGVIVAARIVGVPAPMLGNIAVRDLAPWAPVAGVLVLAVGVCLLESASFRLLPWIVGLLLLTFAAQSLGQDLGGLAVGPFLGAVVATLGARTAELIRPTLPRLVVFLPSFWLLVPGSLGVLGVSQIGLDPTNSLATASQAVGVITGIALGLVVGAALAQALARLVARRGPGHARRVVARHAATTERRSGR